MFSEGDSRSTDASESHRSVEAGDPESLVSEYTPLMSPERAAVIARWHAKAYAAMKKEAGGGQRFDYLGLDLWVPADVQPITGMSHLFGEAVVAEVRPEDHVLDMGTGCGVNALIAGRVATRVIGVDTNRVAIGAAIENARANGLKKRVEFRYSDVFSHVTETFDLIIFDPPFRWFRPRDLLEGAITDENYRTLSAFFEQASAHLRPSGRLLLFFGTSGDSDYFHLLAQRGGFAVDVVASQSLTRDGVQVEYSTYRMTRATERSRYQDGETST